MKKILSGRLWLTCIFMLSARAQAQTINTIDVLKQALAVDAGGNVFTSDGSKIYKRTPAGIVSTIAGTGTMGYSGDGGSATAAQVSCDYGLAVDLSGNVFLNDTGHRIRKINSSGIISTIVGTGVDGYSGDGGPATAAQISGTYAITTDNAGNIYFGDAYRIRKINTAGIVTTIAGNGTYGFSGDGGPAATAQLGTLVRGLTADNSGNLFFSDEDNNRIRKISSSGTITTVAGNGSSAFSGDGSPATAAGLRPLDVDIDGIGNLFIADLANNRVRKVSSSGIISTFAATGAGACGGDGGPATAAQIWAPMQIEVAGYGNVFVESGECNALRKISLSTNEVRPITVEENVLVLPSVNKGTFIVKCRTEENDPIKIEVTNVTGERVYSAAASVKDGMLEQQIAVGSDLPNGMYLLTLRSASGVRTEKFIISK